MVTVGNGTTSLSVTLPDPMAQALRAEAYRQGRRLGDVLSRWMVATWPQYVADAVGGDLWPVLDVEAVEDDTPDASRPGLPARADSHTLTDATTVVAQSTGPRRRSGDHPPGTRADAASS